MENWGPDTRATAPCTHCGLPVRRRDDAEAEAFCCVGCRLAAQVAGAPHEFLEARLLLASFLAMGVMTFSLVSYGEAVHAQGDEQGLEAMRNMLRALLALFTLPVLALLGPPLALGALADLRAGRLAMDGLIVMGAGAACGVSLVNTWRGGGEVYYDTATMVLVLVTLGRRLEARARVTARDAQRILAACLPDEARRAGPAGALEVVSPAALRPGDVVLVDPGGRVPADGEVLEGRSEVARAHLTGEHRPLEVGPGDPVVAGGLNGSGALRVTVTRATDASDLARVAALLEEPLGGTVARRLVDRWAAVLAWGTVVLAGVGAALSTDAGQAIETALAVLVVACPCALGLAAPLAGTALRAALAEQGLLVHEVTALERSHGVDHIVIDKTGTLTDASGRLSSLWSRDAAAARRLVALVARSGHALAASVSGEEVELPVTDLALVPGRGVEGAVSGLHGRCGSARWMDERRVTWPEAADTWRGTPGLIALEEQGQVVALARVDQALRPEAARAVGDLVARGLTVEVLSGDEPAAAASVGRALGVEVRGDCSATDKARHVEALRRGGSVVLVVGDGLNDAPALAAADVAVAMGGGTVTTRDQAHVELIGDDLSRLPILLDAAGALRRAILGNLTWTVAYNLVALGFAATGHLHPLVAAAVMIASSLFVALRSHALLGWRPRGARGGRTAGAQRPGAPVVAVPGPAGRAA